MDEVDEPIRLALSLHAANPALRSQLMPVNDRYPLADVLAECRRYVALRGRKVYIEYVMLEGVNDTPRHAAELAAILDPKAFKVNLIPYNPTGALRRLLPRRDRRLQARARPGADPGHGAPHARPGHRCRLRPARRHSLRMDDLRRSLHRVADLIADYREALPEQRVTPQAGRGEIREALLASELPAEPTPLDTVIDELVAAASPGLMATAGPRYFGFVIGGSPGAALAGDLLTTGWDQCAFNEALAPGALAFEDVAGTWLKDLLQLPATASVGFTTGAQAANTVGLAAGRWQVLRRAGWDVGRDGLNGAPLVRVVAGAERHATIDRSLRLLGLGERAIEEIPATANGAMDSDALVRVLRAQPEVPTIVCAQAGNVNTGACDDLRAATSAAAELGAWVHVDGAFGLWAAASPTTRHLVDGIAAADSWACDGHKWLNVPYDSGFAFCADPEIHATAMSYVASYLTGQVAGRDFGGGDFVPESSRRARGFATWAAIRSAGTVRGRRPDREVLWARPSRRHPARPQDGVEVVNEVVLNQVLVRVGDDRLTRERGAAGAGGRNLLARRDDLERRAAPPHLGLELVDERSGHRALRGRDRQSPGSLGLRPRCLTRPARGRRRP